MTLHATLNRGATIAFPGFAFEHLIKLAIENYINSKSIVARLEDFPTDHQIFRALPYLSGAEYDALYDDAMAAAKEIIEYVCNVREVHHIGGTGLAGIQQSVQLTGKESNADLILKTDDGFLGISLKYRCSKRGANDEVKVRTRTLAQLANTIDDHYEAIFGTRPITDDLKSITYEGMLGQRKALEPHVDRLREEFINNGEDFEIETDGTGANITQDGLSYLRDTASLRPTYKLLAAINLATKKKSAAYLHSRLLEIYQAENKSVSDSLIRQLVNCTGDDLRTILVTTTRFPSRKIELFEVQQLMDNFLGWYNPVSEYRAGTANLKTGPGRLWLDDRPSTNRYFTWPINYAVSKKKIKLNE